MRSVRTQRFPRGGVPLSRTPDGQAIAEAIPHIAWTSDPAGSVEYLNRQGCEYAGFPPALNRGWDWRSLVHPDDSERVHKDWERAIREESLLNLQCRIWRADATFRWHAVASLPLRGEGGEVVGWIGTATDIDDQKRLDDLRRRAQRDAITLEAQLAAAPVGLGFIARDLRWVRVNPVLAAITATTVQNHVGRAVAETMPALWPQVEPVCRQVLETGGAVLDHPVSGSSRALGGEPRSWLTSWSPVTIDDELAGIGMVMVDVTERERQAQAFRSGVLDTMAEGLYTSDRAGRFTFLNAAAERMLGWSAQELHGRPVHSTIHFQRTDGSPLTEAERNLLEPRPGGRVARVADHAFTRRDGSVFPVACSATPLVGGKGSGGLVVVFRDTTEERAERRQAERELDALTWVGRTRDALDEGRVVLYSQPIIPLAGGEAREELLLRMVGRRGEIIRPSVFLPAAEKYGLIREIDQWVVAQAARLAASGRRVQANLSALSLSNSDLLPVVERAIDTAGASPADLVFEITETALMDDVAAGEAFARGVAELGCTLALDDFGTGYGSFTRLKQLPISYLKIDIEFVRDLMSNRGNRHVVEAIVGLARGFGQQTIAEGVEDAETLSVLEGAGVDFAQGHHLGRPAPLTGAAA